MPIAFLLFVLIPIAEMWLLIEVGSQIGALATIGLVMLTAVIGLALLRQQGFSTLMRAQQRMESGQIPAKEMGEGIFLAVGGALLLTPGFMTDAIGFACLIPGVRQVIMGALLKRMQFVSVSSFQRGSQQGPFSQSKSQSQDFNAVSGDHETVEGEYKRED